MKIEQPLRTSRWWDILTMKSCTQKINRSKLFKTHYTQNILWIHQLTPFISISNDFLNICYFLPAWVSAISGKYQIPELLSSRKLMTLSTNPLCSHSALLDTTYMAQITNFTYFTNTDHLVSKKQKLTCVFLF